MKTLLYMVTISMCCGLNASTSLGQNAATQETIRPSQIDPAVQQFDEPNVVLTPISGATNATLAVFLPGTHGKPLNGLHLLNVLASQGYWVIGLSYDDIPAGTELCPKNPDPNCFAGFHAMRSFGRGPAPVSNSYAESIEGRLVNTLRFLDHEHPNAGWSTYLTQDGHPQWSRILISGLSQGAGMAAFIAKTYPVNRVVLFSSPWDNIGRNHRPAPWLFQASATPMDRWWAERHVQENTTEWIANAYRALRIPPKHILLFSEGLTGDEELGAKNPYHGSTIRNPAYERQWRQMFGSPAAQYRQQQWILHSFAARYKICSHRRKT